MYQLIFNTHKIVVILFLLIYIIKTIALLTGNVDLLGKFTKLVKVPEMIISFLFLVTGIYLATQLPSYNLFLVIKVIAVLAAIPLAVIGFKKSNKALAGLSLFLLIGAYGLAEVSKKKLDKSPSMAVSANATGAELYTAYCQKCHGADGKAGIMGASDLSVSSLSFNDLAERISKGKNRMPGFSNVLSPDQLNEITTYAQTLRH